jgi:hypothetical protein
LALHGLLGKSPEDVFAVLVDHVKLIDVGRVGAIAAVDVILVTVQLVYGADRVIAVATVQSVDWRSRTEDARIKPRSLYPSTKE